MSIYLTRLQGERKQWRKDHPFGFVAKPNKAKDGGLDLLNWTLKIPGKKGTQWEGSSFPVTMTFTTEYPTKPPKCQFPAGFYHPNIYPSGTVCLSILNEGEDWRPSHSLKDIVLGIQELLDNPNIKSPAQQEAFDDFKSHKEAYKVKVAKQVRKYRDDQ